MWDRTAVLERYCLSFSVTWGTALVWEHTLVHLLRSWNEHINRNMIKGEILGEMRLLVQRNEGSVLLYSQAAEQIPLSMLWHNGCLILLLMTQWCLALEGGCVYVFTCVRPTCVRTCMHLLVCIHDTGRQLVSECIKRGLLGSPARSLPAIMRMFSVFSSISAPGSLRRESLADARHVADVCYWRDIWK